MAKVAPSLPRARILLQFFSFGVLRIQGQKVAAPPEAEERPVHFLIYFK